MRRILFPRSVKTTTRSLWRRDSPSVINRSSSSECSGSPIVRARGSAKTVLASSNDTRCFFRLRLAFSSSHSKARLIAPPGYHKNSPTDEPAPVTRFPLRPRQESALDARLAGNVDVGVHVRGAAEVPDERRAFEPPDVPDLIRADIMFLVKG